MPSASIASRNALIEHLVALISAGDFCGVIELAPKSRVTAEQMKTAVEQYGRQLLRLPHAALELVDYVAVQESIPPTWSVVVPLFTREEGISDLSVELTLIEATVGNYELEVDDIHVL